MKDTLLGTGAFGKVYLAESKENKNVKYAVKVIPIKNLKESMKLQMEYELEILYKIDHPYVIQYIESFQDKKHKYIVMEYCDGHELTDLISQGKILPEKEAVKIISKLL